MQKAFTLYDYTNQLYRSYRGKTIAGNILLWGGFATVLGGAFIPIYGNNQDINYGAFIGVMAGGLVIELIGSFILQSGQANIFDAVNLYNRHKINEYK